MTVLLQIPVVLTAKVIKMILIVDIQFDLDHLFSDFVRKTSEFFLGNQTLNTKEDEYTWILKALYVIESKPDFWALPSNPQFWIQGPPFVILDLHPRK